jgi:hypothetical protein
MATGNGRVRPQGSTKSLEGRRLHVGEAGESSGPGLVPLPAATERQLVIPSSQHLEDALARAESVDELLDFDNLLALLEEAGRRFDVAIEEAIRVAAYHLRAKRKLGLALTQHVGWGGDRSSSHPANLNDNGAFARVQKDKASRYRKLAVVPEDKFEGFIEACTKKRKIPREMTILHLAHEPAAAKRKTQKTSALRPANSTVMTPAMADAIQRCLGDIDVCVGVAPVKGALQLSPATVRTEQLRGIVVVAECPDPDAWLPRLSRLRVSAALDEVVVVLRAETGAAWFRRLVEDEWSCCFITGPQALILAHGGRKKAAFRLACTALGATLSRA